MTDRLNIVRIHACNVHHVHGHKRLDDDESLSLSLSLQESDGLVCWGAIMLKHKKIVSGQPAHVWQWPLSKNCRDSQPNQSNLIVINPVLSKNLEHPLLTR